MILCMVHLFIDTLHLFVIGTEQKCDGWEKFNEQNPWGEENGSIFFTLQMAIISHGFYLEMWKLSA